MVADWCVEAPMSVAVLSASRAARSASDTRPLRARLSASALRVLIRQMG